MRGWNIGLWTVVAGLVTWSGCSCGGLTPPSELPPESDAGASLHDDGGQDDGGPGLGSDAGLFPYDGGTLPDGGRVDPFSPLNSLRDSDCDGLTDAEEFATVYAGNKRTDPAVPDSDGDGLLDGLELGRTSSVDVRCTALVLDQDPSSRTIPTEPDSDADGLPDGVEDANRNGRVDASETDPNNPDSDGDGLLDGLEDANANGQREPGETDPIQKDTDQDHINDGVERNVTLTDPSKADTDGDSCLDGLEDTNQNGVVDPGETNPKLAGDCGPANLVDSDLDGLLDRVEDANGNGTYDPQLGETDWQNADTDGDGLSDGVEDQNKNGRVDLGETDPRRVDSDCDGLIDGPDNAPVLGEDQNANGTREPAETNPLSFDTDGDGLRDGLERGVTTNPDPTHCPFFLPDAAPATTTNPVQRDSDGDGIDDGAEDANQNGQVDPGELDPQDGNDGGGPAGQVCVTPQLRPVVFQAENQPDLRLGLPATFTEVSPMVVSGQSRGLIGYDSAHQVAFLAWRQAAPSGATTPTQDEAALRTALGSVGTLSNTTTQTFTSWDNVPSLQAFYEQAGTMDLKARANALADALVGNGAGVLSGNGGVTGPFQLQLQVSHRSSQSVVMVLALTPKAHYVEPALFSMGDSAGGTALAQFGDAHAVQCERFTPSSSNVDFLFVVDDSCSMSSYQQRLGDTATAVANSLNNSTLDWRLAMVTTSYLMSPANNTNRSVVRGFTRNIHQFRAWLTQNSNCSNGTCTLVSPSAACDSNGPGPDGYQGGCWIGGSGLNGSTADEAILGAARKAMDDLTPASATEQQDKLRADADLVVVLVGDADDQTTGYTTSNASCVTGNNCEPIQRFIDYFNDTGTVVQQDKNPLGKKVMVHAIVCADGSSCGETQNNPRRHAAVVTATGGIRGDLESAASISTSINAIVNAAIGAAGHKMLKPPLGASVKVALTDVQNAGLCNKDDLPRSRVNGFDFDGLNRTISFFGACRPSALPNNAAAVSYRYWIDSSSNPDGAPPPCSSDPFHDANEADFCQGRLACNLALDLCECPANCGGNAPPGQVCNPNRLVCDFICTPDCGGACTGYRACNVTNCGCECLPNATCAPGYQFQSSGGVCGCVCDGASLGCGPNHEVDPNQCACVCKADCGGCPAGQTCNPSTCACSSGIN